MSTLQWFALSLVVLVLGNTFDGLVTYFSAKRYGITGEVNDWALGVMKDRGLGAFLFEQLTSILVRRLLEALLLWMLSVALFGWSYGTLVASLFPVCMGIGHFLGGLTWLIMPADLTYICLAGWSVIVAYAGPPLWGIALCILGRDVGGLVGRFLTLF